MGTALAIASLIASGVMTARKVEDANKLRRSQTREAERQERIKTARAARAKRIKQAQLSASAGGAGISGSIVEAPEIALESSLQSAVDELHRATESQIDQFDIAADSAITSAIGGFLSSVGTVASQTMTPAGETAVDAANAADQSSELALANMRQNISVPVGSN